MEYFATIVDFQPIIVGAGCLALGYVYGRHQRSLHPVRPEAEGTRCCSQEAIGNSCSPCQAMSTNGVEHLATGDQAKLHTYEVGRVDERHEYMKRGLAQKMDGLDCRAINMKLPGTLVGAMESPRLEERDQRETCPRSTIKSSTQMLGDTEQSSCCKNVQAPSKKQKSMETRPSVWKGKLKLDTGRKEDRVGDGEPPWSPDILKQRINYFNRFSSKTDGTVVQAERDSKTNQCKRKLMVITHDNVTDNFSDRASRVSDTLPTPNLVNDCFVEESKAMSREPKRDKGGSIKEIGKKNGASETQVVVQTVSRWPANHVQEKGVKGTEMRSCVPLDKVLKAEIYELLNNTDCGKVTFEKILSQLEEKLHVDLREDKARIVSLLWEVINFSKLLEEERE